MFTSLINTPLPIMTLSAKDHSILNAGMIDEVFKMMENAKWTCHVCLVQIPHMMEVDHLKGHKLSGKHGIKPICQVCHDLKHLLWAASRQRITIMHAPDLSYPEISQLAWSLVVHKGQSDFHIDHRKILRDLTSRKEDAVDAIGHDNMEGIFEAILTVSDTMDRKSIETKLAEFDHHIKIVPTLFMSEMPDIQVWSAGGFHAPDEKWRDLAAGSNSVGYKALRRAGEAMRSKL